jgi:acylphosphatase
MEAVGVRVIVRGVVQGVGYRFFALRRATALGLAGWVRNRADGSVEVMAEGPAAAVESLLGLLREGPPGARVTGFEETRGPAEGGAAGFRIRP